MLTSIPGIYRNGQIELLEQPDHIRDETRVIVTFLESGPIDLRSRGIDEALATELHSRLTTFANDWNSPEMHRYDNYDSATRPRSCNL